MKKLTILLATLLCIVLAGCGAPAEPMGSAPVESSAASVAPAVPAMDTPNRIPRE